MKIQKLPPGIAVALMSLAFLWFAARSDPLFAQASYPSRAIRIITPLAVGSASDIVLRFLAERLSEHFKVPVVVQNQPGGGNVIADRIVAAPPQDGYTLGWIGNNNAIAVSLFNEVVDPRQDLRPIVGVSEFAYLLVTSADSPYQTLAQWVSAARAKPGTLTIGTSVVGSSNYLAALLLKSMQKLDVTVIPYRGPAELSVALLRGDLDLVINAYGGLRSQLEAGKIRALAVTAAERIPELPNVPTMAAAGVPDYVVTSWNSLYGPKDMPDQAVDTVAAAATAILGEPAVQAKFKEVGFAAKAVPANIQDQRMRSEIDRWARVIADAGIPKQ
jgi:tripartite-type tricarboxylate transporter receptor subunit TctC